VFNTVNELNRF